MIQDFRPDAKRRKLAGKKILRGDKGSAAQIAGRQVGVSPAYV
jgi:hypothetical protein